MDPITIGSIFAIGGKIIDKLFPDPQEKAQAQLRLLEMQQSGELHMVQTQLSAIIEEAKSTDPWTSRARPSFLYVVYVLLLWSIPMPAWSCASWTSPSLVLSMWILWKGPWRTAASLVVVAVSPSPRRWGSNPASIPW